MQSTPVAIPDVPLRSPLTLTDGGEMRSQVASGELVLLNAAGLDMLLRAFGGRTRLKASFPDFADAYLRGLHDVGLLVQYQEPGVDPFAIIKNVVEFGADHAVAMQQESFRWPTTAAPLGPG